MKKILLILFLFFSLAMLAQEKNKNVSVELKTKYPELLKKFFNLYGKFKPSEVETAQLFTGVDSLQAYFGTTYSDNKDRFYWTAIANNDSLLVLRAGFILEKTSENVFEKEEEIGLYSDHTKK
ncbi:hypothetical protein SAMN05444483_1188 [Salegentibacter echinorum]|uniref:Uncharacterized protein n=1 Tax=Salegentibacter echinorum TaxID=1073325 RepID=A0A1M5L4M0_SALEC|nr:hypothetical protein [Salegentibacter echinorum]SHG59709.1 hypothetical protein SAMN05444483_1188 [Salegentibacter echinorum]